MTRLSDCQTEKEFQDAVVELARLSGWLVFHDHDARRNASGLPDLIMVNMRRPALVFAELKTNKGRIRAEQAAWLAGLRMVVEASGGVVHAAVWRPSDWPEIETILTERSASYPQSQGPTQTGPPRARGSCSPS